MARKKKRGQGRLKAILWIVIVLIVASLATVRFLSTDRGEIFLLDIGFDGRYEHARDAIEREFLGALRTEGLSLDRIDRKTDETSSGELPLVTVRIRIPHGVSLVKINNAVDRAVGSIGGRIRTCREGAKGTSITMELGTRRTVTHRCVIKRDRSIKPVEKMDAEAPVIALIVDDFGYFYNSLVKKFLSLDIPITVSVIPGLKYSEKICEQAVKKGKEVLCHLPMEPERGADDVEDIPLVRVAMSDRLIEDVIEKALESTPGISGMNNHMGSKATADRRVMESVLKVCKRKKYFFIDSMTSPKSVVGDVAAKLGVRSLSNDLFIDNKHEDTRENMHKLMSIARRKGSAIGIIHVRRKTFDHLEWMIEEARSSGIRFVTVSSMM
jgi:polysaccharide deacetylase 2 family uncharacterized protein YibQ